ncbi:MAG: hypothetical protein IIB41_01820 [Candidatus Marinimicrobia bacterium]|nr:hypothetical protein [Candidatus Neomarinimicrobiota bacterium]
MIKLLIFDVAPLMFMLALGGIVVAYKKHKLWFYLIVSILFANLFIEAYYFPSFLNHYLFRYLYPSIIMTTLGIAFFVEHFVTTLIPYIREVIEQNIPFFSSLPGKLAMLLTSAFVIVLIVSSIPSLWSHYNHNNRRDNYIVPDITHNILITPEPNAILFSYTDTLNGSLQYYQLLGERSDMTIIPETFLRTDWYVKNVMKTIPMICND